METKQLTGADLIVGNRFECIEQVMSPLVDYLIRYSKGQVYQCDKKGCITNNNGYIKLKWNMGDEALNRHFKLSHQPQEDSAHVCKIKTGLDFLKEQQEFKNQSEPQEEVTEDFKDERCIEAINALVRLMPPSEHGENPDCDVIQTVLQELDTELSQLQQENEKLSDKLNVTQKVFEDVFDKYVKLLPDDSLAKLIETLKSLTK